MIELNTQRRILYKDGKAVELTPSEHNLLMVFYTMGKRVLSLDLLMDTVFNHPVRVPGDSNLIWNLISRLRSKAGPQIIQTKKRQGYLLAEEIRIVD